MVSVILQKHFNTHIEILTDSKVAALKKLVALSLSLAFIFVLVLSGTIPFAFAAQGKSPIPPVTPYALPKGVTQICDPSSIDEGTGMYAGTGGAFVEDAIGLLEWCSGGLLTVIASPPSSMTAIYFGLGGISTSVGLVLVLSESDGHFWFCIDATKTGCAIQSTLITLPSSFCTKQLTGTCNPYGVALDPKLNIWYADPGNGWVVECTAASSYQNCLIPAWGVLGEHPTGIFRASNGTVYDSDGSSDPSCTGTVWREGTVLWTPSAGGGFDSITLSSANPQKKPHIYVGSSGLCNAGDFAKIIDVTDSIATNGYVSLPTPFGPPYYDAEQIYGLTTKLQFTSSGAAFSTKDTI